MISISKNVIAIIPARGGSKRILNKNMLSLAGKPLVAHSILHALQSKYIKNVYVSTEDNLIEETSRIYGAEVVKRPDEISGDKATSESALLHVLNQLEKVGNKEPDLIVFLQCTSPVRKPYDIDRAIETLVNEDADSLFSACDNNRLIWINSKKGLQSINYDYVKRQREQDMEVQYRENGSIYVFKPQILKNENNRLGGKLAVYKMDYWSSFQVDDPEHVELIGWILQSPVYGSHIDWPSSIDLVIFDFDGVMTDNRLVVDQSGKESVCCDRGDGWGIARLHDQNVPMMVLSTEENPVVKARCQKLKLKCEHGVAGKARFLKPYLISNKIDPQKVAYIGNDVNDLECMKLVGFPVAVSDARPEITSIARLILSSKGGRGAVREFSDLYLKRYCQK